MQKLVFKVFSKLLPIDFSILLHLMT